MNNDNNDDRDNDSSDQPTPSNSEPGAFRKEPSFSLFDSDTELEVDDIEAEDFANDYADEGYDDGPFDDNEYTDEAAPSPVDEKATPLDDPIGALWVDDDNPEFEEQIDEQPEKTPWDDEPEEIVNEDQSLDTQAESPLSQSALAATLPAGSGQRYVSATETAMQTPTHDDNVDDPVPQEDELPLEYTQGDSEDERWDDEIDEDDDDYDDSEYAEEPQKLPIGLIIVAVVALALGSLADIPAADAEPLLARLEGSD